MIKKIGPYSIESKIASGGMANIYLATDKQGKRVAIKFLKEEIQEKEKISERFTQEGLLKLDHPHIVKVKSIGTHNNTPYIVMDYIDGKDLEKYIKENGPLPINEVLNIFTQMLSALSYVHKKGIIHRDIKPKNILIDKNGVAKLTDFGIAKSLYSHIKTSTGGYLGAPAYSSPEQMDGKRVDARSDIYSLGITLYQMLVGNIPYSSSSIEIIIKEKFLNQIVPIEKRRKNIPPYIVSIINKSISKNLSDRFQSTEEITTIIKSKSYIKETIVKSINPKEPKEVNKGATNKKVAPEIIKKLSLSKKIAIILPILFIIIVLMSVIIYYNNLNHIPEVFNISLAPKEPTTSDDIILDYDFFDQDKDKDLSQIKWYINGKHIEDFDDALSISADMLFTNDQVYTEVIPYDSEEYGGIIKSEVILVVNSLPIISNVEITPEDPTNKDNIVLSYDYYDPDGDPDISKIEWYVNGEHLKELDNATTIDDSYFSKDDSWFVKLIPYDNSDYGSTINSNTFNIEGLIPNPRIIGKCETLGYADDIFVKGDFVYVSEFVKNGLRIIDIKDKSNPTIIGNYKSSMGADDIYVDGKYAYLTDYGDGLIILDISDKNKPILESVVSMQSDILGIFVENNYAYALDGYAGFKIIDLSDITKPIIIGNWKTPTLPYQVFVEDNYAYIANMRSGLQIIDISDKKNPNIISSLDTPGFAYDVKVFGDYAYVASFQVGLQIIDISDKVNPFIVSDCVTPRRGAFKVFIDENYAYITDRDGGLQIIDISDKENPYIVQNITTNEWIQDIFVIDDYAYVTYLFSDENISRSGIYVIDLYSN